MKKKNKSEEVPLVAREEMMCYQRSVKKPRENNMITQESLDEECISLSESKKRIIDKIHTHFRNV